jgi:putative FmdB family regulatory protein
MPIYEYRCGDGHAFEVMQRISEDPLERCEVCGKPASRVFHPPAVHFKGSGFYNTDYGTRKRAREKEAAGEGAGKSDSTASSGSEGKSAEGKASEKTSEGKTSEAKAAGAASKKAAPKAAA